MDKIQKIVTEMKREETDDTAEEVQPEEEMKGKDSTSTKHGTEQPSSKDEETAVEKLVFDKYKPEINEAEERKRKLLEEGYGGARRKQANHKQKQWRDSSLTRTPPITSAFVNPRGEMVPTSEPSVAIRGPNVIGSPPSYKRFDSPKPPEVNHRVLVLNILSLI